ncbi:MAG: hypothetical protein ACI8RZ_002046 [Myxococcota bacterium]|jgi:hypothetical protein
MFLLSTALAAPLPLLPEDDAQLNSAVTFSVQTDQTATVYVRPAIGDAEPFRIVVLPDTQFYTTADNLAVNGDLFSVQTQWIADNSDGVAFVTYLGDIIQDWDDTEQWAVADAAMSVLDDVVPYGLVVGNHDYPATEPEKLDQALFSTYFPTERFSGQPWWGGGYPEGSNDNSFQAFSVGKLDFLIFHFKFEPGDDVRQWASGVIEAHPDHRVIISTHSFLGTDGEVWSIPSYDPIETLWADLVAPYDNVFMVLSAHLNGEAHRTDTINDRPIHQLLACYQAENYGGGSRLRLMDFYPDEDRIDISTYMPWTDTWEEDEDSMFSLDYAMGAFSVAGSGAPVDGVLEVIWSAPEDGSYEWRVETDDGATSALLTFTVDETLPVISDLAATPLVESGSARIGWQTSEPTDGVIFVDGEAVGRSITTGTAHLIDLSGLPSAFSLRITATDAVGNTASADLEVTLPGDTGETDSDPPTDSASPTDTGAIAEESGCGGCSGGAPGGGLLLLMLLLPLRRVPTVGPSLLTSPGSC